MLIPKFRCLQNSRHYQHGKKGCDIFSKSTLTIPIFYDVGKEL